MGGWVVGLIDRYGDLLFGLELGGRLSLSVGKSVGVMTGLFEDMVCVGGGRGGEERGEIQVGWVRQMCVWAG